MQYSTRPTVHVTRSLHAEERIAQRGICSEALALVALYGKAFPAGGGCEKRKVHIKQMSELCEAGYKLHVVERAMNLTAVFSPEGELITCYKGAPNKAPALRTRGRKAARMTLQARK